jgi:hypothetical protein
LKVDNFVVSLDKKIIPHLVDALIDLQNLMLNNMKERCFAYQNKKTLEWLKIEINWHYTNQDYEYKLESYDSFDRSVVYSARNIIEEDFSRVKLENREDWQLMEVEIEYNFTEAR